MEPAAFRRWYPTVASDLHRYLMRLCEGNHEVEDILQEAFTRLLSSDFSSNFASEDSEDRRRYLFRIATNLVRDRRRWTGRWRFEALIDRHQTSANTGIDDILDAQSVMVQLAPRSRALLWLAYVNGFSHKEIAEILGLAPTSVRVLLARARKKFRTLLERRKP